MSKPQIKEPSVLLTNPYETDELLNQYLAFHYGATYFSVPNYPAQCAQLCFEMLQDQPKTKALDLGCAVGRTTFELALRFDEVVGVDLSGQFIEVANELKREGVCRYFLRDEGLLGHTEQVSLTELGLNEAASRVEFHQGNACKLPPNLTGFDLIFAGNLIDRLDEPARFLEDMAHRVVPGGWLVISSPYTLLEEYTPVEQWVGGKLIDGQPVSVLEGMTRCLSPNFELSHNQDLPFVIRETARKYQHTVAQVSVWQRK